MMGWYDNGLQVRQPDVGSARDILLGQQMVNEQRNKSLDQIGTAFKDYRIGESNARVRGAVDDLIKKAPTKGDPTVFNNQLLSAASGSTDKDLIDSAKSLAALNQTRYDREINQDQFGKTHDLSKQQLELRKKEMAQNNALGWAKFAEDKRQHALSMNLQAMDNPNLQALLGNKNGLVNMNGKFVRSTDMVPVVNKKTGVLSYGEAKYYDPNVFRPASQQETAAIQSKYDQSLKTMSDINKIITNPKEMETLLGQFQDKASKRLSDSSWFDKKLPSSISSRVGDLVLSTLSDPNIPNDKKIETYMSFVNGDAEGLLKSHNRILDYNPLNPKSDYQVLLGTKNAPIDPRQNIQNLIYTKK